jgi:2'-5' RNA ligase
MPRTTRTFIAVEVPENLGHKLARLQTLLAPELPGVRWTTTLPFHLTLVFLGDVADTDLNEVCRATAAAASTGEAFELRLEALGAFPSAARPRVVWVGATGSGLAPLAALQKEVAQAVRAAGYPPDDNRFQPHVTLGRIKPGRGPGLNLTAQVKHYQTWSAGSFTVNEAVVFASTLSPDGPTYAPLGRAPLQERKAGPNA